MTLTEFMQPVVGRTLTLLAVSPLVDLNGASA